MTKLRLRTGLSSTFFFGFLCLCPAQANEVRATVTLNEGTFVFQNPPATTGAPLSISVAGSYGSASISASLGNVAANLDLTGKPTGSDSATAGGRWTESFTISASPGSGLDGTAGNADFTFH